MILKTFSMSFPHVQLWYFLPAQKRGPFNTLLVGSNEVIPVRLKEVRERYTRHSEAMGRLEPYGLTSADAVLPHFIAADDVLRAAVKDAASNSLEHPLYEFYLPWDFARERSTRFIANHELIIKLKLLALPGFMASQELDGPELLRLRQTLAAEMRYLSGFQRFLEGMTISEQYRVFDDTLAIAPWNDSLRARIYAQYSYIASTRRDPVDRARSLDRAAALYEKDTFSPDQN